MTDQQSNASVAKAYADEVSPDSLMSDFRGRPIVTIVAFTVIVHVVVIGVFSIGYLKNELLGEDTSSLSEDERLDVAVQEATSSLRGIAERHGVSPQELSERFTGRDSLAKSPANAEAAPGDARDTIPVTDEPTPEKPQSAIEKELQEKADGPDRPDLPSLEDEDDLFN